MDVALLRYFNEIATAGSLSAAARNLGVSQPTMTAAMNRLEAEFGTRLLMRDHAGVQLTETGRILLGEGARILRMVEEARASISGIEHGDTGRFVLGCHESLGAYFLPSFIPPFAARYPRLELTLWNGTSAGVAQALVARDIQFGLIVNPLPHPELVLVPLFEDAVDLLAVPPEGTTDRRFAAQSLEEAAARLREGPLILAGRVGQSVQLLDRLAADGRASSRRLVCGDLELVKSITSAGYGVGLLPRRVASYGQPGLLRRLHPDLPSVPDTICLAFRADLHRTRAALVLKDALIAHGRELPPSADL